MLCCGSNSAGGGIFVNFHAFCAIRILFMLDIEGDTGIADGAACDPSDALQLQNLISVIAECFVLNKR